MTLREELNELERQKFDALDWSKSSTVLAVETGYSYIQIHWWRKRLGKPKAATEFEKRIEQYKQWDWTKNNTELAAQHGIAPQSVYRIRNCLGMPPVPKVTQRPVFLVPLESNRYSKFDDVDWSKTDVELAEVIGCSREWIRCKRAQLGKPPPPNKWRLRKFIRFANQFKGRETLTHVEANAFERIGFDTFRRYCVELGIPVPEPTGHKIHPWHLINLDLPNQLLEEIWGTPFNTVATWRSRHLKQRCLFWVGSNRTIPEKFKPLIEAERQKAAEWKAQNGNGHSQ